MKCFNHQSENAVALCKSCSRALCPDCIAEVGLSCSCRNRCEADVAILNDLVQRGRTVYQKNSSTLFWAGLFTSLMGSGFLLLGVVSIATGQPLAVSVIPTIMGTLFLAWGISYFVSARRMKQK
jgi:hypothetical protein